MNKVSLDNITSIGSSGYTDSPKCLFIPFILQTLVSDPLNNIYTEDVLYSQKLLKPYTELLDLAVSFGGKLVLQKDNMYAYYWEGVALFYYSFDDQKERVGLVWYHLNGKTDSLLEKLKDGYLSPDLKGSVYSLIGSGSNLTISNLGSAARSVLERDNYDPNLISEVDYVFKSLGAKEPPGRICILNGEPGTGKTHLVRGLLSSVDCVPIVIPSGLVDSLDRPELLPKFIETQTKHKKPLLLIIEDGDRCLVPRKSDNMSVISTLLNLSDGILGAILDLRIVITTNARVEDIDEAILRPGRLLSQMYLGPLAYDQANRVFHRVRGDSTKDLDRKQKEYTLAQIYSEARLPEKFISSPVIKPVRAMGF